MESLNKQQLIKSAAIALKQPVTQVDETINVFLKMVKDALANEGKRVKLASFGSFVPVTPKPRNAWNPHENELVLITPKRTVRFIVAKPLSEQLNRGRED